MESEAFMVKFRTIDEKLCQALEGVPFDQLGISDETKEQVCEFKNFVSTKGAFYLFIYFYD